jgi:hypothetical protein
MPMTTLSAWLQRSVPTLSTWILRSEVAGWALSALVLLLALRTPRPSTAPEAPPRHPWRAPLLVALLALATRLLVCWRFLDAWFYADENFAGCIEPAEFLLREPISLGSFYFSYIAYLGAYHVFGFAPVVPRLVHILAVAVAGALLYATVRRAVGSRGAWLAALWYVAAAPFFIHALYAIQLGLSLLPVAALVWVLSFRSLGPWHGLAVGPLLVVSLYVYPAAFLAGVSLLAVHGLLHWERWRWSGRLTAAVGLAGGAAAAVAIRWYYTGAFEATHWGNGSLTLVESPVAMRVILADTIWRSTSFDAVNLGAPYLDPALDGFVLVGVAAGWRVRDAGWRWALTGALAFVITLILASMGGPYPGIRRAFPAFLLLALPLGRGAFEAARRMPRPIAAAVLTATFGLVAWQSARVVRSWPRFGEPDFVAGARALLTSDDMTGRDVVVVGEQADLYAGKAWRCALVLDERLQPRLGQIVTVLRAELPRRQGLARGPVVVLASAPLAPEDLHTAFGRDPVRTVYRTPNDPSNFARLGVAYVFDGRAEAP